MTAQITGFLTRADLDLRKPRSFSRSITPAEGGAAVHYGGPAQRISSHPQCLVRWKNWQAYHMDSHGWSDIAYTGGFCDHGYAFAGRGHGVRTAANGTNDGNQRFHAYTWIGGEGERPTQAALDALDWWIHTGRTEGGNGLEVRRHGYFKSTQCPGTYCAQHAAMRHLKAVPLPSAPTPDPLLILEDDVYRLLETKDTGRLYAIGSRSAFHIGSMEGFYAMAACRLFIGQTSNSAKSHVVLQVEVDRAIAQLKRNSLT